MLVFQTSSNLYAYPQVSLNTATFNHSPCLLPPTQTSPPSPLLPHHCFISFSRQPQLRSPFLYEQHHRSLPSPPNLEQITHINHPPSQLLTNFSSLYTQSTNIYVSSCTQNTNQAFCNIVNYASVLHDEGVTSFIKVCRFIPPKHTMKNIGARYFKGSMTFLTTNQSLQTSGNPKDIKHIYHN